jgi:zinc transport system ATP-binding protein
MAKEPIITVDTVSKAVDSRQLLTDVTFQIERGSLVSLIGPNGAGKSTLVKIILGLDKQHTGTVQIAKDERIQYIAQTVPNEQHQLPISVKEYFLIAATTLYGVDRNAADLEAALTHVGVDSSKLSQSFASLSGGEKQRVAIARALLSEPTILVLDEPFAAVDYGARQGLYELVRHLQHEHNITTLLVSHDVDSILPISDRILCLNNTLREDCAATDKIALNRHIHHHC